MCRICHEPCSQACPCECGEGMCVHSACLNQWRESSSKWKQVCEVCKTRYTDLPLRPALSPWIDPHRVDWIEEVYRQTDRESVADEIFMVREPSTRGVGQEMLISDEFYSLPDQSQPASQVASNQATRQRLAVQSAMSVPGEQATAAVRSRFAIQHTVDAPRDTGATIIGNVSYRPDENAHTSMFWQPRVDFTFNPAVPGGIQAHPHPWTGPDITSSHADLPNYLMRNPAQIGEVVTGILEENMSTFTSFYPPRPYDRAHAEDLREIAETDSVTRQAQRLREERRRGTRQQVQERRRERRR